MSRSDKSALTSSFQTPRHEHAETATGQVVLLIGTSSSGKTTTAQALQEVLKQHHLLTGFDVFLRMVDERWAGHGVYTFDGFQYDPSSVDACGNPYSTISCGPVGRTVLRGTHRAVAALAHSGNNVIVDEMLLNRDVLADWYQALAGLPLCVVQVQAPLDVLVARERQRNGHVGLARGHLDVNTLSTYDVLVDTHQETPAECSKAIAAALSSKRHTRLLTQRD